MADYGYVSSSLASSSSSSSPTNKLKRSCSSIFTSPWLFSNCSSKGLNGTDSPLMSPTSILDNTKPFPAFKTPFWPNAPNTPKSDHRNSSGVGLGLIDALNDEICDLKMSKPENGMVLFGSKLNVQIPPLVSSVISAGATDSPMSPGDFGIKTRVLSPTKKSPFGSLNSPRFFPGEMELLEEYTCVITRGPNPKTTRIFDDCVVDRCCGVVENSLLKKGNGFVSHDESLSYPSTSFLSFCYHCKKNLGKGNDIYMYRGEKAFCSSECRYKEIMSDEGTEKCDDDIDGI